MPRITASDKITHKLAFGAWGGTDVADVGIRKPTLHRVGRLLGRAGAGGGDSALTGVAAAKANAEMLLRTATRGRPKTS